jgi:hypothetical protein
VLGALSARPGRPSSGRECRVDHADAAGRIGPSPQTQKMILLLEVITAGLAWAPVTAPPSASSSEERSAGQFWGGLA